MPEEHQSQSGKTRRLVASQTGVLLLTVGLHRCRDADQVVKTDVGAVLLRTE